MENAKLSNEELKELIYYGASKNGVNLDNLKKYKINSIISKYCELCYYFEKNYIIGELDTFKRAACLLVAIYNLRLCSDNRINASIAVDASHKMCEKPYWNVGKNCDIPEKLEEVDFSKMDKEIYDTSREMLIDSLLYSRPVPINYYNSLELLYRVALQEKHLEGVKDGINIGFYRRIDIKEAIEIKDIFPVINPSLNQEEEPNKVVKQKRICLFKKDN